MELICIGDFHLGHNKCTTSHITASFNQWREDNTDILSRADGWLFNGDTFDRLLQTFQQETVLALHWYSDLMEYATIHGQFVRMLDGTESHDRRQPRLFEPIAALFPLVDYRYVEELSIEYIPKFKEYILYVPDNWSIDTATTREQVEELLVKEKLHQVDLVAIHGQFPYQLPFAPIATKDLHDPEYYQRISKSFVVESHIHKADIEGTIIPTNSFDRLKHGEEEDKGGLIIDTKNKTYKRLINRHAMKFISVLLTGDRDSDLKLVMDTAKTIKGEGHIRLVGTRDNPSMESTVALGKMFPSIKFTRKYPKKKEMESPLSGKRMGTESVSIHKGNIHSLMDTFLSERVESSMKNKVLSAIKEYI